MNIRYDIEKTKKILSDLSALTGISMSFLDTKRNRLCLCGKEDNFCKDLQSDPKKKAQCSCSDAIILDRCFETKRFEGHICHAGLYDAAMPIMKDGIFAGIILMGRIRLAGNGEHTDLIYREIPEFTRPKLIYAFESLGIAIYEGYGITECGPFVAVTPYYARRVGSVGRPLPGVSVRIESADGGKGEHGYEEGEIEVKSDAVMIGYDGDEAENSAVFTLDGYFRTGDIGYIDREGYLYVTGRKKTVIVLDNGRNVAPEEIEEYLLALPEIDDALIYAKKNEADVLRLYAMLLPSPDATADKSPEEVLALLKERVAELNHRLPTFKRISDISVVSSPFPRNGAGKLLRNFVD